MTNKLTACGKIVNEANKQINELKSVLREITMVYKDLVDDSGGGDHSVGICWCADYEKIARAKRLLGE